MAAHSLSQRHHPSSVLLRHPGNLCQRRRMYEDMNYKDSAALDAMSSLSSNYLEEAIPQGLFHAWLGYVNERPVAAGAGPRHLLACSSLRLGISSRHDPQRL